MKGLILLALLASLGAGAARAGDLRDFCPNRPGKGSPACILDAGRWQVETDIVDATRDRRAGVTTTELSFADFQVRYGLSRRAELDAAWSPLLSERVRGQGQSASAHGSGVAILALRWSLTDPDAKGAAIAVQPFVAAPAGSGGFAPDRWGGGVGLPVALPLTDNLGIGLFPQVAWIPDALGRGGHAAVSAAAGLSQSLGALSFGEELWGLVDDDPSGRTRQASFDLTAAWQPPRLKDVQLDVGLNAGLNAQTPRRELYLGLAKRF
jgi:hypothetical protein